MPVETASPTPPHGWDEAGILSRVRWAQRGDDSAFDELVRHYEAELRGAALFLTGQPSDADDIVQETFIAAYEGLGRFEGKASFKTWLSRILFLRAAKHHRSQRVRRLAHPIRLSDASRELLSGAAAGTTSADALEIRQDVLDALQTLQPEHREVLILRELQGLSYREIAGVLEIADGTVESRLFRARSELKERLKEYL
jgi:RNA polymerase sigma-70 factor, ECF subfamily